MYEYILHRGKRMHRPKMKERICITIDQDLIIKAKELKINVSNIAEAALMRELESFTKNSYTKALENQNDLHKKFLSKMNLWTDFEQFKYKDVV